MIMNLKSVKRKKAKNVKLEVKTKKVERRRKRKSLIQVMKVILEVLIMLMQLVKIAIMHQTKKVENPHQENHQIIHLQLHKIRIKNLPQECQLLKKFVQLFH